jgi:hypothetical protein
MSMPPSPKDITNKWPYNEVLQTRQHFHPKWIFLRGYHHEIIWSQPCSFKAIPSTFFHKETLNSLILTKEAVPLTEELDDIMDCMECWGRGLNQCWYFKVVDCLGRILNQGPKVPKALVLKQCIKYRVEDILSEFWNSVDAPYTDVADFETYFDSLDISSGFFDLANKSIQHTHSRLEVGNYPGTDSVNGEESLSE